MLVRLGLRCAWTCVLAIIATLSWSQDDTAPGAPWAIGLAGQVDDESNSSLFATFNWGVARSTWLSFSAGRSRSPAERADVSAQTWTAGVDHRFGLVGVTFQVERWGDPDALESEDWGGSFYIQQQRLRIALEHESRDIDIPFTLTGPFGGTLPRTAQLSADSLGLSMRVQPAERWQLYFSATEHDYERDLVLLPRIDRLNLLSTSTLTLANSFVDHERMFGFEREFGRSLLNVSFAEDRSAIDGSKFTTIDAGVLFPISRRVDLEVNIGSGRSDLLDSGLYGGVLLLIYGR
ncbi:MAG TPA: hypothetical protein VJA26_04365 [Gammaproteobacteria bacterium]|nr:hypothetical protein [Gammaproteobacteria bacterium]